MTIPAPSTFHFRQGRAMVSKDAYPDIDVFFDDVGAGLAESDPRFLRRRLPLSATRRHRLGDDVRSERARSTRKARGDDPDALPEIYARVTNAALKDKPADMAITMHSCRGNFRSTWIAQGGYEFVAEQLLGKTNLDGYFLEYDSDRAGGFEPLRFFPKGNKQLVLGLVTSKSGTLESKDDIKRRIDQATKYVALDQLCLSPQCGFASTEEGNVLAEDEQWAKLRMIVELSKEVWEQVTVAHQSPPVSRRPCRQPAAPRRAEAARAPSARSGEITAEALKAIEDREIVARHQEAGRCRSQEPSPTANSAAPSGTTIFSASSMAPKPISASARSSSRASTRSR